MIKTIIGSNLEDLATKLNALSHRYEILSIQGSTALIDEEMPQEEKQTQSVQLTYPDGRVYMKDAINGSETEKYFNKLGEQITKEAFDALAESQLNGG